MSTITLLQLRTDILRRADMEGSGFVADAELTRVINVAAAELHELVILASEDQVTTSALFTVAGGASTFALASLPGTAPFLKLRGLDRDEGGGEWREVRRFDFNDRNRRGLGASIPYAQSVRYRLIGGVVQLAPSAAAPGDYRLWYVPEYVDMALDADAISYPSNWHEYVINVATAWCLEKEESSSSHARGAAAAMKARILTMAPTRDESGPATMIRVRNRASRFDDDADEWT